MNTSRNANAFMLLVLTFLIFITSKALKLLGIIIPPLATAKYIWIIQILSSVISFLAPIFLIMIINKLSFKELIPIKKVSIKNTLLIIVLSFLIQPFFQLVSGITNIFFTDTVSATINVFASFSYPIAILVIGITPAIFEELAFRGVLLTGFRNSGFWLSIFMSGLYFGMMHLTMTQLFYTLVAGMFFAFLVRSTGSILSSILSHFILNSTQITITYILLRTSVGANPSYEKFTFVDLIPNVISSLIVLPFFIFFMRKFIKNNREEIQAQKNIPATDRKVFDIIFYINFVLYALFMIFSK